MKNKIFYLIIPFFLFSCASSGLLKEEVSSDLQPFSYSLVNGFNLTKEKIKEVQFFSGNDTIILQKITEVSENKIGSNGEIILTGGDPVRSAITLPNTPGVLVKNGVMLKESGDIFGTKITFSNNHNNYLTYEVSKDEFGTFVLKESPFLTSGEGSSLLCKLVYTEKKSIKKIEPGQKVGQKTTVNNSFLEKLRKKKKN